MVAKNVKTVNVGKNKEKVMLKVVVFKILQPR